MAKRAATPETATKKKRATGKQHEGGATDPQGPADQEERSTRTAQLIGEHVQPYVGDALASM